MDPNMSLEDLRAAILDASNPDQYTDREVAIEQVEEYFNALDDWLRRGGLLPRDWGQRAPEPTSE